MSARASLAWKRKQMTDPAPVQMYNRRMFHSLNIRETVLFLLRLLLLQLGPHLLQLYVSQVLALFLSEACCFKCFTSQSLLFFTHSFQHLKNFDFHFGTRLKSEQRNMMAITTKKTHNDITENYTDDITSLDMLVSTITLTVLLCFEMSGFRVSTRAST